MLELNHVYNMDCMEEEMMVKPKDIKCSVCGEMIEAYWDSYECMWRQDKMGPLAVHDEKGFHDISGVFHSDCLTHGRLWKRIRAIEETITWE